MSHVAESFEDKLALGAEGEQEVASGLLNRGVSVMPLYQFKNHDKAPVLLSGSGQIILPDLMCWNNGKSFFVESKLKRQWVEWNGNIETGVCQKLYPHYLKTKELTGVDVYLFFVHRGDYPGIYYQEISKLAGKERLWNGLSPSGKCCEKPLVLFDKKLLIDDWNKAEDTTPKK